MICDAESARTKKAAWRPLLFPVGKSSKSAHLLRSTAVAFRNSIMAPSFDTLTEQDLHEEEEEEVDFSGACRIFRPGRVPLSNDPGRSQRTIRS